VARLEQVGSTDVGALEGLCATLSHLLEQLGEHTEKEMSLLQTALLQEAGGEG
jgi:hypothetical protein